MNDTKKKLSLLCLVACILISAALCFGQIASSKPVIFLCPLLFLALLIFVFSLAVNMADSHPAPKALLSD